MAIWNVGSFSTHISNIVVPSNVPVSISGTTMDNIVSQKIAVVENYLGIDINSNAVEEKYQGVISNLATAEIIDIINAINNSVQSMSIAELSITNSSTNALAPSTLYKELGMQCLIQLQQRPRYKKVWGV